MQSRMIIGLVLGWLVVSADAGDALRYRTAVKLPEVAGYVTLKCDFHIHTVFSDGVVWPSVRSEEAWRQGLDAIAITDHIEYQPHKADLVKNHNRGYEIAQDWGADLNLLVAHGSEITRSMPPGHLNAIFLTNSALLETEKWQDAVSAARAQGAFIFWNHPGWARQITNGLVLWYPEHTALLEAGNLHGIEVVTARDYYPEAHRWALEKKLAMLSNSDIHQPLNMEYQVNAGDHRPMTLVFAKERTLAALKEALFDRRTAVYSDNRLVGDEKFLRPIVEKSIRLDRDAVTLGGKKAVQVQISNESEVSYELEAVGTPKGFSAPQKITLPAGRTVLLDVKASGQGDGVGGKLEYRVKNVLVGPNEPLVLKLPVEISVRDAK
jgi:3',5'-nucleoside bisphosphate phosphatase